jgi:hypothetical protein
MIAEAVAKVKAEACSKARAGFRKDSAVENKVGERIHQTPAIESESESRRARSQAAKVTGANPPALDRGRQYGTGYNTRCL